MVNGRESDGCNPSPTRSTMILIADLSCPGLAWCNGAVDAANIGRAVFPMTRNPRARLPVAVGRLAPAVLRQQPALQSALWSPGLRQTSLLSAAGATPAAIYQGGPLPPRRLTQRASLEETAG
jgi:hypothetical protein